MTLTLMALRVMKLSIAKLSIMTSSIPTLSLEKLSLIIIRNSTHILKLKIWLYNYTQHNNIKHVKNEILNIITLYNKCYSLGFYVMLTVIVPSVVMLSVTIWQLCWVSLWWMSWRHIFYLFLFDAVKVINEISCECFYFWKMIIILACFKVIISNLV